MKVSFQGRVRKVRDFPTSMAELRRVVSRKYTERNLDFDASDMSRMSVSQLMDSQGSNIESLLNASRASKRRVQLIDWTEVTCFYEDSEGDFNVISEDEDIAAAEKYSRVKDMKAFKMTILPTSTYKQFKEDQRQNPMNMSQSWLDSEMNSFSVK